MAEEDEDMPESLEDRIQEIIEQYGLDETSFSFSYYNTATDEDYSYNAEAYMFAASTYKLPLNMYYYLQEALGNIDSDSTVGNYVLSDAHYLSIVNSDNSASEALISGLGSYAAYKEAMFTTFGDAYYSNLDNLDPIIYIENDYPAAFLMLVLKNLYRNRDFYTQLLSYMSDPNQINGVENTLSDKVIVYQKQGWYPPSVNNIEEIVETSEPYLMVVMTDIDTGESEEICTAVNETVYAYNTEMAAYHQSHPEEDSETETAEEEKTEDVSAVASAEKTGHTAGERFAVYAILCLTAAGSAAAAYSYYKDRKKKYDL